MARPDPRGAAFRKRSCSEQAGGGAPRFHDPCQSSYAHSRIVASAFAGGLLAAAREQGE